MANNLAVTNPTNDNLFGAFGGGDQSPSPATNSVPNGWASGTVFSPVTPQSSPGAIPTPPSVSQPNSQPATAPTAPAPTIPMNYFRNDVGGYNPIQYGNQNAINSVGNFLGPSAGFGETYNQGPFDMAPQSIVNWGGQNHNTGLVQNLINQYGPEQAMRMMQDEQRFARSQGGGNWTLQNDASLRGFSGNRFAPNEIPNLFTSNGISPSASNGLLVNQASQGSVQSNPSSSNPNNSTHNNGLSTTEGIEAYVTGNAFRNTTQRFWENHLLQSGGVPPRNPDGTPMTFDQFYAQRQQEARAGIPTSQNPNANVGGNAGLSSLFGSSSNISQNPFIQLLLSMLTAGSPNTQPGGGAQNLAYQRPIRSNQYPLFY